MNKNINSTKENHLPQADGLQDNNLNTEEVLTRDTRMRTANIRISEVNVIKKDNKKLGLHAGDTVIITKEDIIKTLEDWAKTKDIKYYLIEHNANPQNKHWHLVIEFPDNSVCKFSTVKNKFPYGDIETCKYGVKNCVQYLVHLNNPEKYQYSWDEVISNSNKLETYKIEGKRTKKIKIDYIINQILAGNIKEYEIADKIEGELYTLYGNRIKRAFEYKNEESVIINDRNMQVFVLQGPPRVGKTSFCKAWAKKHHKSICLSSTGKHAADEYRGQEVFVLDDYNYNATPIDDMKKLLDPHNNTGIAARYHNKMFQNVDTFFICTNTPISKWYKDESSDDREAFFKRISYVLDFENMSSDYVATYTVNEVVFSSGHGIAYDNVKLIPVDDIIHLFDLKKYYDVTSNNQRKTEFLHDLDNI